VAGRAAHPFLGKTSRDLDATQAMLDFFQAHPMR
jgi:poly(3-hydroxybutyrate) depolymerase